MRLFVGIAVPKDVVRRMSALVDTMRPRAPLKWSLRTDLHVTTKFIGEQPGSRIGEMERALHALPPRAPFRIAVRGVGWFPDADAPRILWAGVDAPSGLAELAADTERALVALGIAKERRSYSPHVTLARVPARASLDAIHETLGALPAKEFGAFTVDRFALFESRLADDLTRYHALATFPFSAGPP